MPVHVSGGRGWVRCGQLAVSPVFTSWETSGGSSPPLRLFTPVKRARLGRLRVKRGLWLWEGSLREGREALLA